MKLKVIPLLAVLTCVAPLNSRANDIEPGKEFIEVIYTPRPIVLDGDLSEWSGAQVIADPKFAFPKFSSTNANPTYILFEEYNGGVWTGPDDQTSAVQMVYDAENVYLGFVVTDDYHENAVNSAWNGDSVQLMIASADRTTEFALYNYALGGVEGNTGDVIIQHERGGAADPACACETSAVIKRDAVNHKTIYEIKLPKAAVGLTSLKTGPQFGLGYAVNDGDAGPGQNGQKGWGGLGVHSIVHGKTPSETALATLRKVNDIEPGKEYYTALRTTNAIVLDADLSEWGAAPVLADPKFAFPKFSGTNDNPTYVLFEEYNGGVWTGPDDQTSAVQVVYDAENVYLGFVVTDDYHENAVNSPWNGDSVQLMIASADRTTEFALYNYALGGTEENLGSVIIQHERGGAADPTCACDTTADIKRDTVNKKTRYEIKLPAAAVGLTPPLTSGMKFGLGYAVNDGDAGPGQNGQKGWGGLGVHSIVHGKTPSETAEVTLGSTISGSDTIFLSSIRPDIATFSFRANDKGAAIVSPATAKLTIDGQVVTLVPGTKVGDATDFTYTRSSPFAPGSHTYAIEVSDTAGGKVTDSGTFLSQAVTTLTAAQKASSVDTTKTGFIWRVFQNEANASTDLADTERALAGTLDDGAGGIMPNLADPNASGALAAGTQSGPLVKFEIPTTINLSQVGGDVIGNFQPDDQMPGVPGQSGLDDGISAEIVSFVELPAGVVTMGVNSEDGFRTQAGYINNPADGLVLGEFNGTRTAADTTYRFYVQDAGVYPLRTIFQAGTPGADIEWFTIKSDGNKVLIGDTANGGLKAYRVGVAPNKPSGVVFSVGVAKNGGQITITWSEPGTVLQESNNLANPAGWGDVANATSPYSPVTTGRGFVFYRLKK